MVALWEEIEAAFDAGAPPEPRTLGERARCRAHGRRRLEFHGVKREAV
jgi:hypothetical protein